MRWIKWFAIDWINSTARDELTPAERSTWVDFVSLARFPGSTPGTFKFASYEALARKLNTPLEVIVSTRDKCLTNRITIQETPEGLVMTILNWDKYQAPGRGFEGRDNTLKPKTPKPDNKNSDQRRGEGRGGARNPHPTPPPPVTGADPRVSEVMKRVEELRGYVSPSYPREAKAVKWMLGSHPPEDIIGCFEALGKDPFWVSKELLLDSVKIQLPKWVSNGRQSQQFTKKVPLSRVPESYIKPEDI